MRAGKCARHYSQADRQRGTSVQRGYDQKHRDEFRTPVLARDDYTCQICGGEADTADHWPRTRRQLLADGDNPDDPRFGRALCASCHNTHTASTSAGFGRTAH